MAIEAAKARIAVVGAGLMGHGIAQVFALAGHEVAITDSESSGHSGVIARLSWRGLAARLGRHVGKDRRGADRGGRGLSYVYRGGCTPPSAAAHRGRG